MNFKSLIVIIFLVFSLTAKAQVLFTINGDEVQKQEFEYIYKKNNHGSENEFTVEKYREYLELYINFKLKVKQAKDMGLDTTSDFSREFESYREQLMRPYLTDKSVTQQLIDEAYQRHQHEVRASHILFELAPDASPADTLIAYNAAMAARERVLKGEEFATVAIELSKDPSVEKNEGDLGYFTVFQMIYPFENVAFSLSKGEVSKPVRTQFGYHVIKVNDRRPYRGELLVSHLMIRSGEYDNEEHKELAKRRVDSLYHQIKKGASFEKLVKDYSDDPSTKNNEGKLPRFNSFSTYLPDEFKDVAFSLGKDDEISKPFQTRFGWHIVKRIQHTPLASKQEMEEFIRSRISRDSRSELSQEAAINRMKKENGYKEYTGNLQAIYNITDNTLLEGNWKYIPASTETVPLFIIGKRTVSHDDFARYLQSAQEKSNFTNVRYAVDHYFNIFRDEMIIQYEKDHLEEKYPEYRNLVTEYREGIMLFDITDKKVWTKAATDSVGLEKFFLLNRKKYMWKERLNADVLVARNSSVARQMKRELNKIQTADAKDGFSASIEQAVSIVNKSNPLNVTLTSGLFQEGENEWVDRVKKQKGLHEIKDDGKIVLVNVNEILPSQPKELQEIKGIVIADYQDHLENQWIKNLKENYSVTVNTEVLNSLFK